MEEGFQQNPTIFQKIFIHTSLSIPNTIHQQQKLNISEEFANSSTRTKQVNNCQTSIDNYFVNNSYSVINEAEQYIFDDLNHIIQKKKILKSIISDSQLRMNLINTKNEHQILIKQKIDQHTQYQKSTKLKNIERMRLCSYCSKIFYSHIQQINFQQSIINEFQKQLQQLGDLVIQYRKQFKKQQNKINKKFNQFYNQNKLLKQNISDLLFKIQNSKNVQVQKQKSIHLLFQQNFKLKAQLNKYSIRPRHDSRDSRQSQSTISKSTVKNQPKYKALSTKRTMAENSKVDFPNLVRQELQKMIQALVIEVYYQRKLSLKLKSDIKILTHHLAQKQKIEKKMNKEIYKLQLNLIMAKQQALNNQTQMKISNSHRKQAILDSQVDQSCYWILLADIVSNKKLATHFEKFTIGIKIIQIYQKKIDRESYQLLVPEDLIIYYKKGNVQKIFLTDKPKQSRGKRSLIQTYSKQQLFIESLLYNLAFFLQELFKIPVYKKTDTLIDTIQNTIKQKISLIIDDKVGKKLLFLEELKILLKAHFV